MYYLSYDPDTGFITERGPAHNVENAPRPLIEVDQADMTRVELGECNAVVEGRLVFKVEELPEETERSIRLWRRRVLLETDRYASLPDYPMTETQRQELLAYRQALRDCPATLERPPAPEWLATLLGPRTL